MRSPWVLSFALALFLACGGSNSTSTSTSSNPTGPGALPANRVVAGFLDGSGSSLRLGQQQVVLTGATVTMAGLPSESNAVRGGVQVQGKAVSSGSNLLVQSLDLRPQAAGPLSAVQVAAGTMTVLHRQVVVTALTQLSARLGNGSERSLALADFHAGDSVLVFGVARASGGLVATRVERQAAPQTQLLQGTVSGLSTAAHTFTLGTTAVNYATAQVEGNLANGVQVIARGTLAGGAFVASRVTVIESEASRDEGVELRGLIANLDTTAKTFLLAGFTVDYSHAELQGAPLADGAMAEVEGLPSTTQPSLVLASEVEVEGSPASPAPSTGEAKGMISALDPVAMTFSLGTLKFWADAGTVLRQEDHGITLAQLKVGDWVEVLFDATRLNASGASYAVRVDVEESGQEEHELSGTVSAFQASAQTFALGSFTVGVTPLTTYLVEDHGSLTASAFWGTDRTGARVEVTGSLSGTVFTATRIVLTEHGPD